MMLQVANKSPRLQGVVVVEARAMTKEAATIKMKKYGFEHLECVEVVRVYMQGELNGHDPKSFDAPNAQHDPMNAYFFRKVVTQH